MEKNTSKNMLAKSVNFSLSGGLPASVNDGGISAYINMVKNIPHLSPEEEYELAVKVQKEHDLDAAEKLIKSILLKSIFILPIACVASTWKKHFG